MSGQATRTVSKAIYQMAVVTFVASVFWISLSIYEAVSEPAEINIPEEVLRPFNPSIDVDLIEALSKRDQLSDNADNILIEAEKSGNLPTNDEIQNEASQQSTPDSEEESLIIEIDEVGGAGEEASGSGTL